MIFVGGGLMKGKCLRLVSAYVALLLGLGCASATLRTDCSLGVHSDEDLAYRGGSYIEKPDGTTEMLLSFRIRGVPFRTDSGQEHYVLLMFEKRKRGDTFEAKHPTGFFYQASMRSLHGAIAVQEIILTHVHGELLKISGLFTSEDISFVDLRSDNPYGGSKRYRFSNLKVVRASSPTAKKKMEEDIHYFFRQWEAFP
jgi:hypothetical protein